MSGKIAREILTFVVILWAVCALLGSPLEPVSHTAANGEVAIEAGTALCAITVAHLLRVTSGRIRPLLRRVFELAPIYPGFVYPGILDVSRRVAYQRPPPSPPSLERLQILRT